MNAPVVLIAEKLSPATLDALGDGFTVIHANGADRDELREGLANANAVLIRSATRMDAEAISWAPKLQVIARAGVGLDNVDIPAATQAGVMVVNAPTSNVISAAELTVAHILGLSRQLQQAQASLKGGQWERSSFNGVELYEKTVGIVGLGRIGGLVAERLQGFGVELLAYDPYASASRAAELGVQPVSLEELVQRSDFVTLHMPRTPETTGIIGERELSAMKSGAYVLNVARGGLIDEAALLNALNTRQIAGAALDVFVSEPPLASPLVAHPLVTVTPHLGASTVEAQEKAGVAVAKSVRLALAGDLVPDAVNVAGGQIDEYVRPGLPLTEKLGQLLAGLTLDPIEALTISVNGEIGERDSRDLEALKLAGLKGFFGRIVSEPVSFVNAPLIAQQRGVNVQFSATGERQSYRNVITLRAALASGGQVSVSGTLSGQKQTQKIVEINGFELELAIPKHLIVFTYVDRPGIVAGYSGLLGSAGVNIAALQVSRNDRTGRALSVLAIDAPVPGEVAVELREIAGGETLRVIDIDAG